MPNFDDLTYDQFSSLHGGKRNSALAGRFLRRRGQNPTMQMGEAMRKQAILRSLAQQQNLTDQMGGPDQPPTVDPSKPLAAPVPENTGPPLAPKVGGRTSPGTTPRPGGWGGGAWRGMLPPGPGLGGPETPDPGRLGSIPPEVLRGLIERNAGRSRRKTAPVKGASTRLNKRIH